MDLDSPEFDLALEFLDLDSPEFDLAVGLFDLDSLECDPAVDLDSPGGSAALVVAIHLGSARALGYTPTDWCSWR